MKRLEATRLAKDMSALVAALARHEIDSERPANAKGRPMKRLEAMLKAKSLCARISSPTTFLWTRLYLGLAEDMYPGTEFDEVFALARAHSIHRRIALAHAHSQSRDAIGDTPCKMRAVGLHEASSLQCLIYLGEDIAKIIEAGDAEALHRMGNALNKWKRHKPKPDMIRALLIATDGLIELGRVPRAEIAVRDLLQALQLAGIPINDNTPRLIRRRAKELGIDVHGTPGRPRKTGTKVP